MGDFVRLFGRQVVARLPTLLLLGVVLPTLVYVATRQVADSTFLLLLLLMLVVLGPGGLWLLGGLGLFGRARPPLRPHLWAWSAYLALLFEVLLLLGVLLYALLTFAPGQVPLAGVAATADGTRQLLLIGGALLLGPPASALLAGAVTQTSRGGALAGLLTLALLSASWWILTTRLPGVLAGLVPAPAQLSARLMGVPSELCAARCQVTAPTLALLFQPLWATLMLVLAGRALGRLAARADAAPRPTTIPPAQALD
jgi:hypothetical protein